LIQSTRELGIYLQLQTEVKGIVKSSHDKSLTVTAFYIGENEKGTKDEQKIETYIVVHGAGRVPDVDTLSLESATIEYDKKKGIKVNEFMQSVSNPAVYAAGDAVVLTGGAQLTPVAIYEGKIVASKLINGNPTKPNYIGVPSVVFTLPPLASVGLQESVAKERGLQFKTKFEKNTSSWYTSRRIGERHSGFKVLVEQR
jgi:glutathione reductase (NADPH)